MKTTLDAQLANVVNGSVTMFSHSVQRLRAAPSRGGLPEERIGVLCLMAHLVDPIRP
jgi:hypothetical protein